MIGTRVSRTLAAAVACATVGVATIAIQANADDGAASSFVATSPCRLFDFRTGADNVGPRAGALGADESVVLPVTGTNGDCAPIPADATAVAMNVTAVGPTADTFVSVTPGDETGTPSTSSLNLSAGAPPTPNKVDVALADDGTVRVYNLAGSVFVLGDVVGYYVPAAAGGTPGPQGPAGREGPAGPQGPAGNDGRDGADGGALEIRYVSVEVPTPTGRTTGAATCPAGTVAIGGGLSGGTSIDMEVSRPTDTEGSGWTIRARTTNATAAMTVTAVCASATLLP